MLALVPGKEDIFICEYVRELLRKCSHKSSHTNDTNTRSSLEYQEGGTVFAKQAGYEPGGPSCRETWHDLLPQMKVKQEKMTYF